MFYTSGGREGRGEGRARLIICISNSHSFSSHMSKPPLNRIQHKNPVNHATSLLGEILLIFTQTLSFPEIHLIMCLLNPFASWLTGYDVYMKIGTFQKASISSHKTIKKWDKQPKPISPLGPVRSSIKSCTECSKNNPSPPQSLLPSWGACKHSHRNHGRVTNPMRLNEKELNDNFPQNMQKCHRTETNKQKNRVQFCLFGNKKGWE